ncbi:c4d4a93d-0df2-44c8-ae35-bdf68069c3f8 [Sclerotinia trifoliorum]|uniref:RBR-type E3 ubiquitin transferase n=1 Tax=Sclerotinia trifoliorum TaxID=28548 RepID=A0A8H2VUS3_9HELO|nr:c4d4a93d-0df2-44c8-ae35-bdf68069c3f8 [Sclerotinia trifoliorum]
MNSGFENMNEAIEQALVVMIVLMLCLFTILFNVIFPDYPLQAPREAPTEYRRRPTNQKETATSERKPYRKCKVCSESLKEQPLEPNTPERTMAQCDHLTDICLSCLRQSMSFPMNEGNHILKCPICSQDLETWFIQLYCTKSMFTKYCELALKNYSRSQSNFNWCLAPKCGSGQIHEGDNARMICISCKEATCVQHQVPWHESLTCAEYDDSTKRHRGEEEKSREEVRKISVACPRCSAPIQKKGGCAHIKCVSRGGSGNAKCGYEFCYYCLVPWQYGMPGHRRDCREFW